MLRIGNSLFPLPYAAILPIHIQRQLQSTYIRPIRKDFMYLYNFHCNSEPNKRLRESYRRLVAGVTPVSCWMSWNIEQVGINQPSVRGGLPSTSARNSIGGLSNGSGPSVTIRSPESPVVGSKPGPPIDIKSLGIGAGVWNDICSRIPYYASDWTDAWNYRVVPATALIFFAKYGFFITE